MKATHDRAGGVTTPPARRGHPVREYGWPLDVSRLLMDPVWRGVDVADGAGHPVMLIPGFLAGDVSLNTLARWLRRRGYTTGMSGIRYNVGCSERRLDGIEPRLEQLASSAGQPVSLVGHSRGGLLAFAMAGLRPDLVRRVITLGSPILGNFDVAPLTKVAVAYARQLEWLKHPETRSRGCLTERCQCSYRVGTERALSTPTIPLTAIIASKDGVVEPSACAVPGADVHFVRGTHMGMGLNPEVYRILGNTLASQEIEG